MNFSYITIKNRKLIITITFNDNFTNKYQFNRQPKKTN